MSDSLSDTDRIVRDVLANFPNRRPCIEVVDPKMAEILHAKTPAERLAIAWGLWSFARDTLRRSIAAQHPEWSDDRVKREAAKRMLPEIDWDSLPVPSTLTAATALSPQPGKPE